MLSFAMLRVRLPAFAAVVVVAAVAADAAAAGPADRPDAYAHAIPVRVSGRQAVVQLPLPRAVYLEARSGGLRDLRLFDAEGNAMPFALVERTREDEVARSAAPAAIFAVRAPAGARQGLPDGLQIRTRADGTVISVTPPAAGRATGPADELASLVLDLQSAGPPHAGAAVAALKLTLPPGVDGYQARLAVDTIDDLQHWAPLAETAVSWLANAQGASVHQDRIAFAPRAFRYARIAWLEGKPLEFAAVSADYVTEVPALRRWDSVVLQPAAGKADGDLVYAAPVAIPVRSVGLVFQQQNVVLPALVGQYRRQRRGEPGGAAGQAPAAGLEPVASATFYRLTQNGQPRVSTDVDIAPTHAAEWVVRPRARVLERPALRLRWMPATMVFVAGGKGPYTLAFGREGAPAGDLPLAQVAPGFSRDELAALEQAQAGAPLRRQAADRGRAWPAGLADGRTLWLWTLLLIGVAVLAAMAWQLSRQLKR